MEKKFFKSNGKREKTKNVVDDKINAELKDEKKFVDDDIEKISNRLIRDIDNIINDDTENNEEFSNNMSTNNYIEEIFAEKIYTKNDEVKKEENMDNKELDELVVEEKKNESSISVKEKERHLNIDINDIKTIEVEEENANELKENKIEEKEQISIFKKILNKIILIYKKIFTHPEDFEKTFLEWFNSSKKLAFLTAIIVGVITHITFLTDMIMSQDGLWNSICYSEPTNWEICLGRWGIFIADKIVNNLAIPTVVGIVGILLIAISTVLIVDLLKLKNKITVFLVATAMVVSPALTATFLYIYTAVAYCLSMLLSVITVCLIFKKKNKILNFILAIVLFTFSLGIYQSYIGVTVGLAAIRLIRDLFDKNEKIWKFFLHGIMLVLIVVVGGLLYSHITSTLLENLGLSQVSYKGMDSISIENTINLLDESIPKIYNDFSEFYFGDEIIKNTNFSRQEFYKLLFVTVIILELISIFSTGVFKNPFRILFIIIMNVILPIALNCVLLLTTETSTYALTAAQMMLIIPFAAMICELSGKRLTFIFKWATIISMFLIVFTYYLADNASYIALKLRYNQAYATAVRIMDRMEETEGYDSEKPILIAGIISDNDIQYIHSSNIFQYTIGSVFDDPIFHGTYSGMEGNWTKFMSIFLGMRVQFCNTIDYNNIMNSQDFKEMEIFPAENSVKSIYNVMVVKLDDNPPMP